jgi:hypothetical protein
MFIYKILQDICSFCQLSQKYWRIDIVHLNVMNTLNLLHIRLLFDLMLSLRSALFWDITRRRVVIVYWRFETTYRSLESGLDTLSRNVGK